MIYLPLRFDLSSLWSGGAWSIEPATNIINEFNDKEIVLSKDCNFW